MFIQVRLFAVMAQHAGIPMLTIDLPDAAPITAIQSVLQKKFPSLPWPNGTLFALNHEYALPSTPLKEGDEVAIIPPVSGG